MAAEHPVKEEKCEGGKEGGGEEPEMIGVEVLVEGDAEIVGEIFRDTRHAEKFLRAVGDVVP